MNIKRNNTLSSLRLFSLALSSICFDTNPIYYTKLEGCQNSVDVKNRIRKELKKIWNIKNSNDLKSALFWFLNTGSRKEFNEIHSFLINLSEEDKQMHILSLNNEQNKLSKEKIVSYYLRRIHPSTIAAYDYACYSYLCRTGFLLGYISHDEAWKLLENIAPIAQNSYSNWSEYIVSYQIGYEFFSTSINYNSIKNNNNIIKKLFFYKKSLINQVDWNTDLDK